MLQIITICSMFGVKNTWNIRVFNLENICNRKKEKMSKSDEKNK